MVDKIPTHGVLRDEVEQESLRLSGPDARIRGVVERDDAVAVAVDAAAQRRVLIFRDLESSALWYPPTMVISGRAGSSRPDVSRPGPNGIAELHMSQTAPPGPDKPECVWMAVSGLGARDAVAIEVAGAWETMSTPVGEDGFFLALVRARWSERVQVYAVTTEGRRFLAAGFKDSSALR